MGTLYLSPPNTNPVFAAAFPNFLQEKLSSISSARQLHANPAHNNINPVVFTIGGCAHNNVI